MFKIVHMSFASLALIAFVIRAVLLFWQPANSSVTQPATESGSQSGKVSRIVLVAIQHLAFTVLIVTGIILLYQNQFVVKPWFYAKIILFVVILSATIKAFGKRDIGLAQRKAGVVVASIAFAALFTLVIWKPDFSRPSAPVNAAAASTALTASMPASQPAR